MKHHLKFVKSWNQDLVTFTIVFRVLLFALLATCFIVFRSNETQRRNHAGDSIAAALRNELTLSNSYAISKTLVDLENLGVFQCARLTEISDTRRIFYDTVLGKKCDENLLVKFASVKTILHGLNGISYELYFIPVVNWYAYLFEILVYILILLSGTTVRKYVHTTLSNIQSKNAILEIQKNSLAQIAQQASHDIASPLSAIKMMTDLIPNIDPEVRNVLLIAIRRTQKIFDDLKSHNQERTVFCAGSSTDEIVREKKLVWGNSCKVSIDFEVPIENSYAVGVESDFKRILSNLLNNSFESFEEDHTGEITVKTRRTNNEIRVLVYDNGRGIPEEVLQRLGQRGFSSGKEGHLTAGAGIGVHHAMTTLSLWGGELVYSSKMRKGTMAEIRLVPG